MRPHDLKVFTSRHGPHVFAVRGSRLYAIGREDWRDLAEWQSSGQTSPTLEELLNDLEGGKVPMPASTSDLAPVRSFSLNLAQVCNMRCGYCYADHGKFGGDAARMAIETGRLAVDRLFESVGTGTMVMLGFLGGEPLLQRDLLREVALYAEARALEAGCAIRFSLTTNGTLVGEGDARFFSDHAFHVTISVDGNAADNDRFRVLNNGCGTYASIRRALAWFREEGWPRHLGARCTLTPHSSSVVDIVDHLLSLGFDSAGVAPVLASPQPDLAFHSGGCEPLLGQMIAAGRKAQRAIEEGRSYAFSNFTAAMSEIHRGSCRSLPCGAGAGYLSVSADGRLFACHRLIGNEEFAMGDLAAGIDNAARLGFLAPRHVDFADPCRSCWARYLCGGGCHHEVAAVGRPACDYVRGWLEFCLRAYSEIAASRPDYLDLHDETTTEAWRKM